MTQRNMYLGLENSLGGPRKQSKRDRNLIYNSEEKRNVPWPFPALQPELWFSWFVCCFSCWEATNES